MHQPLYSQLWTELGIIEFDRGTKIAASRFILLSGLGARLEHSVIAKVVERIDPEFLNNELSASVR